MALIAACGCTTSGPAYLVLATTTSVANSGLLDMLVPAWQQTGGAEIRPVLSGSGRALRMLEQRQADVVISHAPAAETEYLARHPEWLYRKIMFNDFAVAGPVSDPAGVQNAATLEDAVRRIARGSTRFVSRGDRSGTHEREEELWKLTGASPAPPQLVTSGAGMAVTLRQAAELQAYTLTDRATFEQLKGSLTLTIVWAGDPRLLNTYAVIDRRGARATDAVRFASWLETGKERELIASYRISGSSVTPFEMWPANAPSDAPAALPR